MLISDNDKWAPQTMFIPIHNQDMLHVDVVLLLCLWFLVISCYFLCI